MKSLDNASKILIPKFLEYVNKDNKYLVINPIVPAFLVTNEIGMCVLKLCNGKNTISDIKKILSNQAINLTNDKIKQFLILAQNLNIFLTSSLTPSHKNYILRSVYFNMTEICNLSCKYCYATERKEGKYPNLTLKEYQAIIDEVLTISPKISFNLTGGEPLISPNTIPVAQYLKEKGQEIYLLTNATLINTENVSIISELFDHVRISIDGSTAQKHDFYRGKGNYNKSVNAIKLLQDKNVDIRIAMVVTKENVADVNNMQKRWGNKLTYQPLFPAGNAKKGEDLSLGGLEYYEALNQNSDINPFTTLENIIAAQKDNRSIYKCAIGDGEFSISCTGDVYPCQLLHLNDFLIGNVHEKSIKELYYSEKMTYYKQHTVDKIEKCKDCFLRLFCGGACQARHYYENNTIEKAGNFCEYEKKGIIDGLLNNYELVEL